MKPKEVNRERNNNEIYKIIDAQWRAISYVCLKRPNSCLRRNFLISLGVRKSRKSAWFTRYSRGGFVINTKWVNSGKIRPSNDRRSEKKNVLVSKECNDAPNALVCGFRVARIE